MNQNVIDIKVIAQDLASKTFKSIGDSAKNLGNDLGNHLKKGVDQLKNFVAVGAGAAVAFAGYSLKLASDAEESLNAVNVVFESASQTIIDFSKTAATEVGLSANAFRQLSTSTGALLAKTGIPLEEVADHTVNLTKRAADLASVFNTDVNDAMSAINQALRGETEAIRKYTGDVTDATLEQFRLAKGMTTAVGAMSEQEKRLLRMQVIMEQTAFATGDFANTSDSLANRTRILRAQFEDIAATLGAKLLPVATKLLEWFSNILPHIIAFVDQGIARAKQILNDMMPTIEGVIGFLKGLFETLFPTTDSFQKFVEIAGLLAIAIGAVGIALTILSPHVLLIGGLIAALALIWTHFGDDVIRIVNEVRQWVEANFGGMAASLKVIVESIVAFIKSNWSTIEAVISVILNSIKGQVEAIFNVIVSTIQAAVAVISGIFKIAEGIFTGDWGKIREGIEGVFMGLIDFIKGIFQGVLDTMGNVINTISDAINKMKDLLGLQAKSEAKKSLRDSQAFESSEGFKQAAGFAKGADFIVPPGYPNDSFPMRVQSGEHVQVTPANEAGGGKVVIENVNISNNADMQALTHMLNIMI